MKSRIISIFLAAELVIFTLCLGSFTAFAKNYTTADLTSLTKRILSFRTDIFDKSYDYNGDGKLNIKDLLWLKKQLAIDSGIDLDDDEVEIDIRT